MEKKRVVCFVLLSESVEVGSDSSMSFFAILDDPEQINQKQTDNSSIQPLLPFTGLKPAYQDCSFVSFEDQVYAIGGTTLPLHLRHYTEEIQERLKPIFKDHLKDHSFHSLTNLSSNRVLRFEAQRCLDSLFQNNQMEKVEFVELDDVSNHSQTYWGTCPSLTTLRNAPHILHLRGKLYAIGGYTDRKHSGKRTSLIEVYDQGVWAPLKLDCCSEINSLVFLSVAIEKDNMILIGSNESFFKIDVGKGSVVKWKGVECPDEFVLNCFLQPGFVINQEYALWYDDRGSCIRLLNLITKAYFMVDLPEHVRIMFLFDPEIACTAKLIDLGEGVLCLIFVGTDLRWEHGVEYALIDYHFLKFEIIFDHESEDRKAKKSRKSFPGVQLYTRLISHHKFYAPKEQLFAAAFAMDVHVPQKKNLLHTSYFKVDNLKYPLRT